MQYDIQIVKFFFHFRYDLKSNMYNYAQKQNASCVFAIVWASVCLSVSLSHS